jgi:hypothetical protein
MLSKLTTKCMLGIEWGWNGGLVDWKGNRDGSWKGLIPQSQNTHFCLKL